jgi:hypothetical protein
MARAIRNVRKYLPCPTCKKRGIGKVKSAYRYCKYCGGCFPAYTYRAQLLGIDPNAP